MQTLEALRLAPEMALRRQLLLMGRLICARLLLDPNELSLQTTIPLAKIFNFFLHLSHATLE